MSKKDKDILNNDNENLNTNNEETGSEIIEEVKEKVEEFINSEEESRYKTIQELPKNLWTYGSPILFEKCTLDCDQIMKTNVLVLSFTNLDERKIQDVYVTVFAGDNQGDVEQIEHHYSGLMQKTFAAKGSNVRLHINNKNADNFQIKIDGVKFEDGSYWYKEDAYCESIGDIEDIKTFAEEKAKEYEDTYNKAKNAVSRDESEDINKGIELLENITWYKNGAELIKDAIRKYEVAKKNEERKQAREDSIKQRKETMKKRTATAIGTVAIIALLVVLTIFAYIIPNQKYNKAKKLVEEKKYNQAQEALTELGDFKENADLLAQTYYNQGLEALDKGNEKEALELFQTSYDTSKKSDYGKMAKAYLDYYAAVDELKAKQYDKALEHFTSSANVATDFNLVNKASAGVAEVNYLQNNYETAWNTIKNVYAKDKEYKEQYAEYGYGYAKTMVDSGKIEEGLKIYNQIAKLTKEKDLNESVYNQAVKLAENGKISESMDLLNKIKKGYKKANNLYEEMYAFHDKVNLWLGEWRHKAKVEGKKVVYKIYISELLYKGEMCLRIKDKNNKYLGFDTVISSKNRVTQITIGTYQLKFKLKKFHDQKFVYSLLGGNKMERVQKYDGEKYKTKYKKKK
jgi:tetratricopeptide (TPR) repeat protein